MLPYRVAEYLYCQIQKIKQQLANLTVGSYNGEFVHLIGTTSVPIIQSGDGAGIGSIVSIDGDDLGGSITVTIGTSPVESGIIAEIVFAIPYTEVPYVIISDADDNYSMGITSIAKVSNTTLTGFEISAKAGITLDSGNYKWNYIIKQ